jgi:hypothetical protein
MALMYDNRKLAWNELRRTSGYNGVICNFRPASFLLYY